MCAYWFIVHKDVSEGKRGETEGDPTLPLELGGSLKHHYWGFQGTWALQTLPPTLSVVPERAPHTYSAATAKSLQSCLTLCDPIDGSPWGSPIPGILQASTLEWVDISFSSTWKWKVKVKSLSRVRLCATPWTVAHQAPPSMGFFQARVLGWGAIAFSMNVPFQINILDVTWSENLTVCFTCWILSISLSMNLPLECKYFLHDTCCEDPLSTTEKMLKLNVHATKNDT